jgi:hypothetical protein
MGFTAYAQLRLPQVAAAFAHLAFPAWFRIELSWAKFAGLAAPADSPQFLHGSRNGGTCHHPVSAALAHLVVGEGFATWGWAAGTAVLWGASYFFWRRLAQPVY